MPFLFIAGFRPWRLTQSATFRDASARCGGCSTPSASTARATGLWFVGDLVNRGPDSLATLRLVKDLGDGAVTVLGNHDFHLLAVAAGHAKKHRSDTLDPVLAAPDREELLAWLRQRPMLHVEGDWAMVHAGLLPQWRRRDGADRWRSEVEAALRGAGLARISGARSMATRPIPGARVCAARTACASSSTPWRECAFARRTAR